MKATHLLLLLLAVTLFSVSSCSDNDDNESVGEYLEVTVNNKTIKKIIGSTSVSGSTDFSFIQTTDTHPIDFMLCYYSNLSQVVKSTTGAYRLNTDDEPHNFDLDIYYVTEDYNYLSVENGHHTVTAIRRSGDGVVVEGCFGGTLENGKPINGNYRIVVY